MQKLLFVMNLSSVMKDITKQFGKPFGQGTHLQFLISNYQLLITTSHPHGINYPPPNPSSPRSRVSRSLPFLSFTLPDAPITCTACPAMPTGKRCRRTFCN